jgi:hypothetical protein
MRRSAATLAFAVVVSATMPGFAMAQSRQGGGPPAAVFGPAWRALIGDWVSVEPAQTGSGASSFRLELDGRAIVRRNRAEIASGAARTTTPHEDLMVIYPIGTGNAARALYVDNEDHVIQYAASWSPDGKVLTFVSDAAPGAPRFRLVYAFQSASDVSIAFEIATPDNPDTFKTYVTGKARRTASAPAR